MGIIKDAIQDLWKKITDWVRDLLESATRWLIGKIEDFTVWLKVTRHKFNLWLADFLATDTGFWIALATVAVLIVGVALAIKSGYLQEVIIKVEAFIAQMKYAAGSVLARLHFSELYSLNEIVKILLPFYDKLWDAMYKAMGALAEELGLGVGTITAFLRNSNALIISTYTAVGYTMNEAEVIYMQQSNEFFIKVDDRFERYARNPEYVFKDINNEIVIPALQVQGEAQSSQAILLDKVARGLVETDNNITDVENSMKQMVDDLPEEINAVVTERTDVFFETIDDFHDEYITPMIQKIVDIDGVFKDYYETQELQRLNWSHLLEYPANFLMQIETMGEGQRIEQRIMLTNLINSLGIGSTEYIQEQISKGNISFDESIYELNKPIKPIEAPYIKPPKLIVSKKLIISKIDSWFVGEY